jgi:hypothetical protein
VNAVDGELHEQAISRTALRAVAMALALAGLFGSAGLTAGRGLEPSGETPTN